MPGAVGARQCSALHSDSSPVLYRVYEQCLWPSCLPWPSARRGACACKRDALVWNKHCLVGVQGQVRYLRADRHCPYSLHVMLGLGGDEQNRMGLFRAHPDMFSQPADLSGAGRATRQTHKTESGLLLQKYGLGLRVGYPKTLWLQARRLFSYQAPTKTTLFGCRPSLFQAHEPHCACKTRRTRTTPS